MLWIRSPTRHRPRSTRSSNRRRYSRKTGYSRPHTVHCGPEGIYVSTLGGGGKDGTEGPPGVFIMDCETFDILGRWEIDRGPQKLHYDFWWNLPGATTWSPASGRVARRSSRMALFRKTYSRTSMAIASTSGISGPDAMSRRSILGANHQMALEKPRPCARSRARAWFSGCRSRHHEPGRLDLDLVARRRGKFHIEKTATIPPESRRLRTSYRPYCRDLGRCSAAAGDRHRPLHG